MIEQIVQCGQYVAGRPAGSLLQADRGSTPAPIYIQAEEGHATDAWAALWDASGHAPGEPGGAAAWLSAKDEALRLLDAARDAAERSERAVALAARARSLGALAAAQLGLEPENPTGEDQHARTVRLRTALADRRAMWSRVRAAEADVTRCLSRRDAAERALADLSRDDAARLDEWSSLAARFGWRTTASVGEAEAVLRSWEGLTAPVSGRETARRRLLEIRADNRAFRARVAEVAAVLAGGIPDARDLAAGEPDVVVRHLEEGLAAERAALTRRGEAGKSVDVAARELEVARHAAVAAEAAEAEFRRRHGLGSETDCVSVGQRAAEARHLRGAVARRRIELLDAGGGLAEATLRDEAGSTVPEIVAAEAAALGEREEALVDAGQLAAQEASAADAALAQVRSKVGGVDARGRERTAALAFAGHAERWLVLAAAQGIMGRAVERYRAVNQHPMVARAGELMAGLTRGHPNPIERLSAEYRDERRLTLLGVRRDGSPCEIANMTEGTRDQLFLGLRIAAIERHAQAHETLPFVADDLFITSDDERTECGLRALAALASTTQVILFTHHLGVLRSAERLAESHGVLTHLLLARNAEGTVAGPTRFAHLHA